MNVVCSIIRLAAIGIVAAMVGAKPNMAEAGSAIYVGQQAGDRISINDVDHSSWDSLLRKYVDPDGYVNYKTWQASHSDRRKLTDYLNQLSQANPEKKSSRITLRLE